MERLVDLRANFLPPWMQLIALLMSLTQCSLSSTCDAWKKWSCFFPVVILKTSWIGDFLYSTATCTPVLLASAELVGDLMEMAPLPSSCRSPGMDWLASLLGVGSFLSGSGLFSSCRILRHLLTARPTQPSRCSVLCPGGEERFAFLGEMGPVCCQDCGQQHK